MSVNEQIFELTKPDKDNAYFRIGVWDGDCQQSRIAIVAINPKNSITTENCSHEKFVSAISCRRLFEELYQEIKGQSKTRDNYDLFREKLKYPNIVETNISAYPSSFNPRDENHQIGIERSRSFRLLLRPEYLMISAGTPWSFMNSTGEIVLGSKTNLAPHHIQTSNFLMKWREIEIYRNSLFNNRPVTIMHIPQGSGRWLRGVFIKEASRLFQCLGDFLRQELRP